MPRGTGITSLQMKSAPNKAVFVWCNEYLDYARDLAAKIRRKDLRIVGPSFFDGERHRGMIIHDVILDHNTRLTDRQRSACELIKVFSHR